MLKFEWDALRTGDAVLVHDDRHKGTATVPGTVTSIEVRHGVNGVAVRLDPGQGREVVWPSYLAVHRQPLDLSEPCWRCGRV